MLHTIDPILWRTETLAVRILSEFAAVLRNTDAHISISTLNALETAANHGLQYTLPWHVGDHGFGADADLTGRAWRQIDSKTAT